MPQLQAWQKCERDLRMLWPYCCMAVVLEDEDYLQNKLLYWMATILMVLLNCGREWDGSFFNDLNERCCCIISSPSRRCRSVG